MNRLSWGKRLKDLSLAFGVGLIVLLCFCYFAGIDLTDLINVRTIARYSYVIIGGLVLNTVWCNIGTESASNIDEVVTANDDYHEARKKIVIVDEMDHIIDFCENWTIQKKKVRQAEIIGNAGIKFEEFQKASRNLKENILSWFYVFKKRIGEQEFSQKRIVAIVKAQHVRVRALTPGMLLSVDTNGKDDDMISPKVKRLKRWIADSITLLFTSLLCIGLTSKIISGHITKEELASFIFVVYFFITAATKGYSNGYKTIAVDTVKYRKEQVARITEYLSSEFYPKKCHEENKRLEEKAQL